MYNDKQKDKTSLALETVKVRLSLARWNREWRDE